MTTGTRDLSDLTVIVPVRNAEPMIEECLQSIVDSRPGGLVVVDGLSTDRSVQIAKRFGARVLSDDGRGVAAARQIGAAAAGTRLVALIDVDVRLRDGDLAALVDEFIEGGYDALQAGLVSTSGPGYWGQALVDHHRSGWSRRWFGLVATIMRREMLLDLRLDERFVSGEDIELRWRLEHAGARIGVSRHTTVEHRFGDTWEVARGQFLADGAGLARMVLKHGWRALPLLALPAAAAVRGIGLSLLRRKPRWIPYYLVFWAGNWAGMVAALRRRLHT